MANDPREMREGADVDMGGKSILARGNKYIGLEARVYLLYKKQQGQVWLEQNGKSGRKWYQRSGEAGGQIRRGLLGHFKNIVFILNG